MELPIWLVKTVNDTGTMDQQPGGFRWAAPIDLPSAAGL